MDLLPDNILLIQLIVSFIAGGSLIALLTFAAEKAGSRTSGVILAIPSTAALGFFFMGWAISPEAVAEIVPGTIIPLGLCILFPVAYIYSAIFISKFIKKKLLQIILSFIAGSAAWMVLAIPLVIYRINDLWISVPVYFLMVVLSHTIMNKEYQNKPKPPHYSVLQKILRACFVGLFIVAVVYLGKKLDPLWGGALAMFPVAFSSSLMVIHTTYEPRFLFATAKKIPVGSISIFVFNITVMLVFPIAGFIIGTACAYITSLVTTMIIIKVSEPQKTDQNEIKRN